jgi:hypothetical protein
LLTFFLTSTTTESQFTAGTFTNGFEITDGDTYHRRLMTYGAPPSRITGGDERFRAGWAYDPAVNKMPGFATASYTELAV